MSNEQAVYLRESSRACQWPRLTIVNKAPLVDEFFPWLRDMFGQSSRLRLEGGILVPMRDGARWASYSPQRYYAGLFKHVVLFNDLDACIVKLRFNVKTVNARKFDYMFWKPRAWGQWK